MNGWVPMFVVCTGMACASFTDFTRFKVYNTLTFPLFFGGMVYGIAAGGWSGLGFALAGALIGFGVLLIPYLMGGLGAGDVKFVMAMGTWLGGAMLLPAILLGCMVVFIYHAAIIKRRDGSKGLYGSFQLLYFRLLCFGRNMVANDQFESVQSAANSPDSKNHGRLIPFSAMMSVGIAMVLVMGKVFQSVLSD